MGFKLQSEVTEEHKAPRPKHQSESEEEEDDEDGEVKAPADIVRDVGQLQPDQLYLVSYIRLKSDQEVQQDALVSGRLDPLENAGVARV